MCINLLRNSMLRKNRITISTFEKKSTVKIKRAFRAKHDTFNENVYSVEISDKSAPEEQFFDIFK